MSGLTGQERIQKFLNILIILIICSLSCHLYFNKNICRFLEDAKFLEVRETILVILDSPKRVQSSQGKVRGDHTKKYRLQEQPKLGLFTLFSRLAQHIFPELCFSFISGPSAENWTKTKGFGCSCNLYFLDHTDN